MKEHARVARSTTVVRSGKDIAVFRVRLEVHIGVDSSMLLFMGVQPDAMS